MSWQQSSGLLKTIQNILLLLFSAIGVSDILVATRTNYKTNLLEKINETINGKLE